MDLLTKTKNAETRMNTGFQHKQRRYETWTFHKKCSDLIPSFNLVPVAGLEPARCRHRWILSPLRLPIPSHRQIYRSPLCRMNARSGKKLKTALLYMMSFQKASPFPLLLSSKLWAVRFFL